MMGKPSTLMTTLREYTEVATVHGISYIFSQSIPRVDRVLWTFFTTTWYKDVDLIRVLTYISQLLLVNLSFNHCCCELARESHCYHSEGESA